MLLLQFFGSFRTETLQKTWGLHAYASWNISSRCNWRHISPWIEAFCLEIHFPLYFFSHLLFFLEMIPFMASLKKKLIVWEEVCCGLGIAKAVVVLQVFMHLNNHILFTGNHSKFLTKSHDSLSFPFFLSLGQPGIWVLGSWEQMGIYCLRAFSHESSSFVIGRYHLFSLSSSGTVAHV